MHSRRELSGKNLNIRLDIPITTADGIPVIRDLDKDETIALLAPRIGKVFADGSVAYLGTRYDLSGNGDELVVTVGYRRMF